MKETKSNFKIHKSVYFCVLQQPNFVYVKMEGIKTAESKPYFKSLYSELKVKSMYCSSVTITTTLLQNAWRTEIESHN